MKCLARNGASVEVPEIVAQFGQLTVIAVTPRLFLRGNIMAMQPQNPQKQGSKEDNQGNRDQAQRSPGRDQSAGDTRTQGRQPTTREEDEQRRDEERIGSKDDE